MMCKLYPQYTLYFRNSVVLKRQKEIGLVESEEKKTPRCGKRRHKKGQECVPLADVVDIEVSVISVYNVKDFLIYLKILILL